MRITLKIFLIVIICTLVSCKSDVLFESFTPIKHWVVLSNESKWDTGYMDSDSNIIFPLLQDTFQIHFDIIKNQDNALIFSTTKTDTVGSLKYNEKMVFFRPKKQDVLYKLFDFNAVIGDSTLIKNCGLLANDFLIIDSIQNIKREIIQNIRVIDNSPFPKLRETKVEKLTVSSEYGIIEMEIYVGWSAEKKIKIKNAP